MAAVAENVATAGVTMLALAMLVVALRAWRYSGSSKVLLLSIGFGFFFAKGVVATIAIFQVPGGLGPYFWWLLLTDLAILGAFYAAALR